MATITSTTNGFFEVGSTWVGGVAPVEGDKVIISHTVEISGGVALTIGDDTTTGVGIYSTGTLKFSRVRDTDLTIKGNISVADNGTFDMGTIADPISGVSCTLRLNKSASMAQTKYGFETATGARVYIHGEIVERNTTLVGTVSAGATSIVVASATNWKPGDKIFIGPTEWSTASVTRSDFATIHSSYTPGSTTVPLVAALLYPHTTGVDISNLNSNILITNYDTTGLNRSYFSVLWGGAASANECLIRYCKFDSLGWSSAADTWKWGFNIRSSGVGYSTAKVWYDVVGIVVTADNMASANTGTYLFSSHANITPININDSAFISTDPVGRSAALNTSTGTVFTFNRCNAYSSNVTISSSYSQGGQAPVFNYCNFMLRNNFNFLSVAAGLSFTFNNCKIYGRGYPMNSSGQVGFNFNNCDIGYTFPLFITDSGSETKLAAAAYNYLTQATFTNCMIGSNVKYADVYVGSASFPESNPTSFIKFKNKNNSAIQQEYQSISGYIFRDNTTYNRSSSSIMIQPLVANGTHSKSITVATTNNIPVTVIGYLRFNTAWGISTPPTVTLSGLGITPQVFTGTALDTWQKFTFTATQSSGADGNLTITIAGATANANGNAGAVNICQAWLSGCVFEDYVTSTRHYGYLFDGLTYRTVDPKITQATEATVAAYTTLETLDNLYDYATYWAATNPTLATFWTIAGNTLDIGATNLVVDASLGVPFSYSGGTLSVKASTLATGTKFTKIKTTGTITKSNGAIISALYESNLGASTILSITLPLPNMTVCVQNESFAIVESLTNQSGDYTLLIDPGATGTWYWGINKQGYVFATGSFTPELGGVFSFSPSCAQVTTPSGEAMYQATTSSLIDVSISGGFMYIDIGNGTPPLQAIYDMVEDELATCPGINWILEGGDGVSIFNGAAGDFLFMTDNIRLRRWHIGDTLASVPAFAQSTQSEPVDEINGSVKYLTSDSPLSVAEAVWSHLVAISNTNKITNINKLIKLVPATL